MSYLAIGIISRTIVSVYSRIARTSGIVLLSTLGRYEPSTAISLYPLSFILRVVILVRCTNSAKIKLPLALESIIAYVSFPLIIYLVRNTGVVLLI